MPTLFPAGGLRGARRREAVARGAGAELHRRELSRHRRMLPGIGMDFRHALRVLRRNPGYAFAAILCLALAIGVNTTSFSLLDSVFFRNLPVAEAGRIIHIARDGAQFCTWRDYLAFHPDLRTVETAAARLSGD